MTDPLHNLALDGPRLDPFAGNTARQLVVLLHGYGADGTDLIELGQAWQDLLPEAVFVAPNAPEPLPFEAFGGRQWFALAERSLREYRIGAEAAQAILDRFLDTELRRYSLDDTSLALVGFSQGTMMALQCGLHRKFSPAAIVGFSGLLPGADCLGNVKTSCPILIVHGTEDDVVPCYHADAAHTALTKAGIACDLHKLTGLPHSIDERGLALGGQFLKDQFFRAT
ncbi:dienelactone hydrolase family protein [uncultured Roseibium sp.]|uniref:alpha/beta hydrolase n=1 Tax=uncultured Roseibium sp. TaxID=1936171 RepID=UPI0026284DE6|nr:dienelactone hydrolase family protein [uncultured Roseibium sp.]